MKMWKKKIVSSTALILARVTGALFREEKRLRADTTYNVTCVHQRRRGGLSPEIRSARGVFAHESRLPRIIINAPPAGFRPIILRTPAGRRRKSRADTRYTASLGSRRAVFKRPINVYAGNGRFWNVSLRSSAFSVLVTWIFGQERNIRNNRY